MQNLKIILITLALLFFPFQFQRRIKKELTPGQCTLLFTGDIHFHQVISNTIDKGIDPLLYMHKILTEPDYTIGNLETVVSLGGTIQPKTYNFKAPPYMLKFLTNAGFDILSLANNHAMDYGADAMIEMLDWLNKYGLFFTGAGTNINQAAKPILIKKDNIKIGILCFGFQKPPQLQALSNREGTAGLDWNYIEDSIIQLRPLVDFLILFIHWGWEYFEVPIPEQKYYGHRFIDSGADLIVGHHPHVIEGIEFYKKGVIFYSIGNFLFYQWEKEKARTAIIVKCEITKTGNTILPSYFILPIYRLSNTLQPIIAGEPERKEILDRLLNISRLKKSMQWVLEDITQNGITWYRLKVEEPQ